MVKDYEAVSGDLPREGSMRLYPEEAVERLEAARTLRDQGGLSSLEAALQALASGQLEPNDVQPLAQVSDADRTLLELREEVRSLTRAVGTLIEQNRVLHEQMKALEPARSPKRWWQIWR